MKYNQIVEDRIYALLDKELGQENFAPGTDRLLTAYSSVLGEVEQSNSKVVIIGGTNGKGECALSLAHLLKEEGISASLWSSPHILSITERFYFDGEYVDYGELEELIAQTLDELKAIKIKLTYYEFLFLIYLKFSLRRSPDVMILEVGLGGRFDAVNLLTPSLTAITSISRDHQAILGNSYRSILGEKLGITRSGVPLITNLELKYCRKLVSSYAQINDVPVIDLSDCRHFDLNKNYSWQNQFLAASLFSALVGKNDLSADSISNYASEALEKINFPTLKGRLEKMTLGERTFIFIGAHNVDGMRKMVSRLQGDSQKFDQLLVAFSKRPIADVSASLAILSESGISRQNYLTMFSHNKANTEVYDCDQRDFERVASWENFVSMECDRPMRTLIIGSYYFIGEVQKYLENI